MTFKSRWFGTHSSSSLGGGGSKIKKNKKLLVMKAGEKKWWHRTTESCRHKSLISRRGPSPIRKTVKAEGVVSLGKAAFLSIDWGA